MDLFVYRDTDISPDAVRTSDRRISYEAFVRSVAGWRGLLRFAFRYRRATLRTYSLETLARPFLLALALRLASRGRVVFSDDSGQSERISLGWLSRRVWRYLLERHRRSAVATAAERQVESLGAARECPALAPDRAPLYLRTDLAFGLRSGGSIGHIAGVLNCLDRFTQPPVFISSDVVPTVRADIEAHVVRPPTEFADFPELWASSYTRRFIEDIPRLMNERTPSFIYQRYGLNNYAGLALARHWDVPFVLEFNSPEVWKARHWGKPLEHEDLALSVENANLRGADLVVVVSSALRDEITTRGVPGERILVNPNGVDPEVYSPSVDGAAVREHHDLSNLTVLGFIGTFGRWHGAEVLAEAFGRLIERRPDYWRQLRLLLVGDGVMMSEVLRRLDVYGMSNLVVITGTVPQEDGPAHLAAADILVSPHVANPDGTPFFGSPTKVFEYMAMGKGIVASRLDQIGEVLSHGETGWLVDPGDPDALAEGLERLVDDSELRSRIGIAARKRVVAEHTWQRHTERIIEALHARCESLPRTEASRGGLTGAPTSEIT